MQYPIIDNLIYAYLRNGWTGLNIPETITYEPIQLGSGIPTPYNIRPILPATILNIGGNDIPVYGGSLDVSSGVLTIDMSNRNLGALDFSSTSATSSVGGFTMQFITDDIGMKRRQQNTPNTFLVSAYLTAGINVFYVNNMPDISAMVNGNRFYITNSQYQNIDDFKNSLDGVQLVYELANPITYQLTNEELINTLGIKNDIAHRLKLPLPHYFPHPVIDALISAADGQQTEEENEILRHYLTPLGIGGI